MAEAKKILTDAAIRKWRPTGRKIKWDAAVPGFGVRPTDRGKKMFVLSARYPDPANPDAPVNPTARVLGEHGVDALDEVRARAREWLKLIKLGKDPAAEEQRRRQAEEQARQEAEAKKALEDASTFGAAFELFATTHLSKLRTGKAVEQAMRRELLPIWQSRPLASLTRKDVSAAIYSIHDRGAPYAANRMLSFITKFDDWAFNRDFIDSPFATRLKRPAKEVARDRVFTNLEIHAFWVACEQLGAFGRAGRMLFATAARLREVSEAPWTEFDIRAGLWTIPQERTKASREHKLPLSRLALTILEDSPRLGPHVFSIAGRGPVRGWGRVKRQLDDLMLQELRKADPSAELKQWRLHDVRRTVSTRLGKLGVDRVTQSKILNHANSDVTGIHYDHYGRDREMVDALEGWAIELERIVAGPVVVPMKGRRK